MQTAIQITHVRDLDDDHEVGGQDLPMEYTAEVVLGNVRDAIALMDEGLGAFRKTDAFNVEALASNVVRFLSFNLISEKRFDWTGDVVSQQRQALVEGKLFHSMRRQHHAAVMAAVPAREDSARNFWWDRVHLDPCLTPLQDCKGNLITPGMYCRFTTQLAERVRSGTGWVSEINSHPERPIALYVNDEPQLFLRLGVQPGAVEILTAADELAAIEVLARKTRLPAEVHDWIGYCLAVLPASGSEYMPAEDRARWEIQHQALKAQYEALKRLWD